MKWLANGMLLPDLRTLERKKPATKRTKRRSTPESLDKEMIKAEMKSPYRICTVCLLNSLLFMNR